MTRTDLLNKLLESIENIWPDQIWEQAPLVSTIYHGLEPFILELADKLELED